MGFNIIMKENGIYTFLLEILNKYWLEIANYINIRYDQSIITRQHYVIKELMKIWQCE